MNYLNLDTEKTQAVVKELNILLADYHIYYQKLRNFHWNVTGENFFELHVKFEELYNDALLKIDETAERILTLNAHPISTFSEYIKESNLSEAAYGLQDVAMVKELLSDHGKLIAQLRKVTSVANAAEDEGTLDITGTYIQFLEKTSWMLNAWVGKR